MIARTIPLAKKPARSATAPNIRARSKWLFTKEPARSRFVEQSKSINSIELKPSCSCLEKPRQSCVSPRTRTLKFALVKATLRKLKLNGIRLRDVSQRKAKVVTKA
jgi:hypothetical protein